MDQIQIINLGLGHISQQVIEDLNESSVQAEAATLAWEPCLKECLRGNNWSFACVIEALASVANYTPPTGWLYAYAYPSTAMAVWRISNAFTDPTNKSGEDFREIYVPSLSVRVLLTNCQQAYAEYTYYLQDTTQYDSTFVSMLAFRLAAEMAMPLNADPELAKESSAAFKNLMSDAQRQSSYENNARNGEPANSIIASRSGGSINGNSTSIGGMTFDQFNSGQ